LDAAGYAKHIIQINPITNTNSSHSLFFILVCNCLLAIFLKEAAGLGAW
jgi:hypothetical protein